MARRIRSIKPEILEDTRAVELSDTAWRLWVSLWIVADDAGNFELNYRFIAATVWHDTNRNVAPAIDELLRGRFLEPYTVEGRPFAHVRNWGHQRIDKPGAPKVPGLDKADLPSVTQNSENIRECSRTITVGREGKGEEGKGKDHNTTPALPASNDAKSKRGCRITPDWKPKAETIAGYRQDGIDAEASVAEFVDHWIAVPGQRGLKLDWEATFRNRMRALIDGGRAKTCASAESQTRLKLTPERKIVPCPPEVRRELERELMGLGE